MKVGRTTRLRSAPGRSWEIICERTLTHHAGQLKAEGNEPLCDRTVIARDDTSWSEGGAHHCPDQAPLQECHPQRRDREGRRLRTARLQVVRTSWLT